jgi:hypothetical protein
VANRKLTAAAVALKSLQKNHHDAGRWKGEKKVKTKAFSSHSFLKI